MQEAIAYWNKKQPLGHKPPEQNPQEQKQQQTLPAGTMEQHNAELSPLKVSGAGKMPPIDKTPSPTRPPPRLPLSTTLSLISTPLMTSTPHSDHASKSTFFITAAESEPTRPVHRRRTRRSVLRNVTDYTAPKLVLPDLIESKDLSGSQIVTHMAAMMQVTDKQQLMRAKSARVSETVAMFEEAENQHRILPRAKSHRLLQGRSLAASDGDLDTQDDGVVGTQRGNALDITGKIPQQNNIGRVSSWAVGFERLLEDQLGLECFTQFLKLEFSDENIMFWIACEQMGKMKDKASLEKHAQDIYEKFLSPNASMPVNLEGQCRELVEEAIKSPTPEMFRTQQQQIFKLMKFDSYSRFLKSKMYQDCVIAEMAGEPLPFLKSMQKPADDPAKLAASEERANKKKSIKKKNRRPSEGSDNSYPSDTIERKRRPVLPWNKVLPGKMKKNSSADLSQDDDTISRTSNTSDAAENSGMELGTHGKYQSYSTAVRFLFPNNDTVTLPARSGCSVRDAILPLCEARQLPVQALEIFQSESKESKKSKHSLWKKKISSTNSSASDDNNKNLVDLEQELSTLAGAEVIIERRIIFKIELPNHRVIGVKSKPTKKIIEVLRPVTYKYKLMLDSLVVHLSESPVPLDLDITVASLDGQRILIETMEQYSAGTYKPQNSKHRLFKSSSMDSLISGKQETTEAKSNPTKEANNNDMPRDRTRSTGASSQESAERPRKHAPLVKSPSIDLNPPLAGIKKRGNLRVTGTETEDLIAQLSKANKRMDDQRGLTIKDLELPDFLKIPENKQQQENENGDTRPKTSLGAPYLYEMPEFLKSYENNKRTSRAGKDKREDRRRAEIRSKSTPPTKEFPPHFNEGTIPTHEEAEALFGSELNGSIHHMHFNDSMMNVTGRESTASGRPSTGMSGISFHSSTSEGSLNRSEQFSPRSYQATLARVNENNADGLEWDLSDINASMNKDEGEGDRTLIAPNVDETLLPPPPTPNQLDHTLEEANYSPPPPMNHNNHGNVRNQPNNSSKQNGSTIPGPNYNQNHSDPVSHLEDPMLRYTDRSPGPPSPSTHDLVVSPGSGDQDPSYADGSQLSYSTSSTVTEDSARFGNSSYSGHSTYSSNSSQSHSSSMYNRPPAYPHTTSDPMFKQAPPYSRTISAPQNVGNPSTTRSRYPPPPVKPKPSRLTVRRTSEGPSGEVHQRGKARNEMTIIGKDGRKMRASFV